MNTTEIFPFAVIAVSIALLRVWISHQADVSAARLRVRSAALWTVSALSVVLLLAGLLFPTLRPTTPVGFFVAFGAIALLAAQQRAARRTANGTKISA